MFSLKDKLHFRGHAKNSPRSCDSRDDLTHLDCGLLSEEPFIRMLSIERKRSERSRKLFLLMLADVRNLLGNDNRIRAFRKLVSAVASSTRETDISGWYEDHCVLGIIFTEISGAAKSSILSTVSAKVITALGRNLDLEQINKIRISFYLFPEEWDKQDSQCPPNTEPY